MLSTERLQLIPPQQTDDEDIFRLRSNERVNHFIQRDPPKTIEDARAHIERVSKNISEGTSFYWVIRLKESDDLIGTICLWNFSEDKKTAEIGYEMFPEYYGKGYMSEAMGCVLDHGFQTLGVTTIEAFTHRDNERSTSLLKKHGFKLQPDRRDEDVEHNRIFTLRR